MGGKLLLFDIDGTLLRSGGAGGRALFASFLESYAEELPQGARVPEISLAGTTDLSIYAQLLGHFSLGHCEQKRDRFFDLYLERLGPSLAAHDAGRAGVLPGVVEMLGKLKGRHHLSLLTGNIQRAAWLKLDYYGLRAYFGAGAFGDDHADRNALAPHAVARERAQTGREFSAREIVVIGDTPKDIACGQAHGAHTIAVATGQYSAAELAEHGPSAVVEDFSDYAQLEEILEALAS